MDGGVEDGGRREGKLPSVKKDKEEDIDRRIARKESERKLILTSALRCRPARCKSAGITKT